MVRLGMQRFNKSSKGCGIGIIFIFVVSIGKSENNEVSFIKRFV